MDIRQFSEWVPTDLSFQSTKDKRGFYHRELVAANEDKYRDRIGDQNKDGVVDWRDLTVLSEQVHRIADTDGDGWGDTATVFAEGFNSEITGVAAGVLFHDGWVYLTAAPDLWRLKDKDGDGAADIRESVAHGFGVHVAYAGHNMHGPTVGPDGRVYWSIGDKGLNVLSKEGKRFAFPNHGAVMRCEPDGSNFEVFAHGLRNVQEIAFDDFGNLFSVDNDGDMKGERERFVYIIYKSDSGWRFNWQYRGGGYNPWMAEELFKPQFQGQAAYITPPISNFSDGPSGFAYNPGTALNERYRGYFFVTEFPGKKLTAFRAVAKGAGFEMEDPHVALRGLMATGLNFGPDGKLYIADWAGSWALNDQGAVWTLDDPEQVDSEIRREVARLLREGINKETSTRKLAKLMAHQDKRVRQEAQFELVERGEAQILWGLAERKGDIRRRLHAVWGLGMLGRRGELAERDFSALLSSDMPEVRCQTLKILMEMPEHAARHEERIVELILDESERVEFFAAQAAGELRIASAVPHLVRMLELNNNADPFLRHAGAMGLAGAATPKELADMVTQPEAVRLAAVVALRRQASPAVSVYLTDPSEAVAAEAARAVHDDGSIPEALPALADIVRRTPHDDEALLRRALNANYRLGGAENARNLAAFAADYDQSGQLRLEALEMLEQWAKPSALDKVEGRYRELGERDPGEIREAVSPLLLSITQNSEGTLREAATRVANKQGLKLDTKMLSILVRHPGEPIELRVEALRALASGHAPAFEEAIAFASKAEEAKLRLAAAELELESAPLAALETLRTVLIGDFNYPAKQRALALLEKLPAANAAPLALEWMDALMRGEVARELHLDVLLLAEALASDDAVGAALQDRLGFLQLGEDKSDTLTGYAPALFGGNAERGRDLFFNHVAAQCVRCHKVGGDGSEIGPDLTKIAAQRDRAYLLESIVAPNVTIAPGYGTITVVTRDGSALVGTLQEETDATVTLESPEGHELDISKGDIVSRTPAVSVMPPMSSILSKRELRDLMAYLATLK